MYLHFLHSSCASRPCCRPTREYIHVQCGSLQALSCPCTCIHLTSINCSYRNSSSSRACSHVCVSSYRTRVSVCPSHGRTMSSVSGDIALHDNNTCVTPEEKMHNPVQLFLACWPSSAGCSTPSLWSHGVI